MSEKMRGLILKEVNTGEADKIITVLTEKNGKISVLAKNIRRVKGRFGAGASFLCYSDFEVEPSRNELYYLRRATPVENFFSLSEQIEKLALAAYLGQLTSAIVPECFPTEGRTLALLLNTFYVLANTNRDIRLVKSVFELRLMAEEGYAPETAVCAACGSLEFPLSFSVINGAVFCPSCAKEDGILINETLYKALSYILNANLKKIYAFSVGEENLKVLSRLAEDYCMYHTGREIPALNYLKSLI